MSKMILAIAPAALLLASCASADGDFPSLAKRDYETEDPFAEPVAAPVIVSTALPAELQSAVNALVARAQVAQAKFDKALPAARTAAQRAADSTVGSETWVNAHMLLSRADGTRADAVAALGEIDRLIAGESDKGADAGLVTLLTQYQGQISALTNAQTAEVERLSNLIGF